MLDLPLSGGCQCGACRYEISTAPYVAYTCHCRSCQKLTASAFLSCMHVPRASYRSTLGTPLAQSRRTATDNQLTTSFCGLCGSTLFADNSSRPRMRTMHIGSLDTPDQVEVSAHIWVQHKLSWVILPEGHRVFEGAGDWTQDYAHDPASYS